MNKKGFAVTPVELIKLAVVLLFGLGCWFVYWGVREWIIQKFQLSIISSIFTGLFILLVVLFITKYKPYQFILGG